jgi:hypothetical protein
MSVGQVSRTFIFEGARGRYEVPSKQWAEMLLLLEDRGWKPEQQRTWYLATGFQVSERDSEDLAQIGRRVLDAALADPAAIYPVRFDMAKFHEFVEFCEAGPFRMLSSGSAGVQAPRSELTSDRA